MKHLGTFKASLGEEGMYWVGPKVQLVFPLAGTTSPNELLANSIFPASRPRWLMGPTTALAEGPGLGHLDPGSLVGTCADIPWPRGTQLSPKSLLEGESPPG